MQTHVSYRVFVMIQGDRAAGLTNMGQCSSRRNVSAEKMIFVDAYTLFLSRPPVGPHGQQLLVSLDYLNAKSENDVCASKYDRGVVKITGSNS